MDGIKISVMNGVPSFCDDCGAMPARWTEESTFTEEGHPPYEGTDEHTHLRLWCCCGWEANYTIVNGKAISGHVTRRFPQWN